MQKPNDEQLGVYRQQVAAVEKKVEDI